MMNIQYRKLNIVAMKVLCLLFVISVLTLSCSINKDERSANAGYQYQKQMDNLTAIYETSKEVVFNKLDSIKYKNSSNNIQSVKLNAFEKEIYPDVESVKIKHGKYPEIEAEVLINLGLENNISNPNTDYIVYLKILAVEENSDRKKIYEIKNFRFEPVSVK